MTGPSSTLQGVRVLDLTRNLAGPFCTMILGDLGADVVKVEQPGRGDDTRQWTPPEWGGQSPTFLSANRNKRSVAVDIDAPAGVEVVRRLARRADVLVETFRPGSLEKRGLGYEQLAAENPGLVYCSISAYGARGPMSGAPGYDPVLQAATGIMSMTGEPDRSPVRVGIGAIDLGSGLWAVVGIMSALARRAADGRGCRLEGSLYETGVWWMSYHLAGYLASGAVPERSATGTPFIAPYEVFPTAEGELMVAAANDNLFRSLAGALELPELVEDARFTTNPSRVAHRDELRALLRPRFLTRAAVEWEKVLADANVPCSRVRTVADVVHDEHTAELGLLTAFPHPAVPDLRLVDMPVSADGTRAAHRLPPPLLGEHTDTVLAELGYDGDEVAALRHSGAVA
ncbi:MAG TPA: CoA transferase [Acidimicrobiales bacterium]|nr:CoA transferase [Acidimicrobiales bacterium]